GDVGPPAEPGSGDMGAPWGGAGSVGRRRGTPPLLDRVEWESNPTRAPLEASECGDGTWWYPRNAAGGVRGGRARRPRRCGGERCGRLPRVRPALERPGPVEHPLELRGGPDRVEVLVRLDFLVPEPA